LKNSSKNSSNGDPGGSFGMAPPELRSTFCLVEILTTASMTCSATSAMPSGPRAAAGADVKGPARMAASTRAEVVLKRNDGAPIGVDSPGKGDHKVTPN